MDEQEWIEDNAALLCEALVDPDLRNELLTLLGDDERGRDQERRIHAARVDLASLELRMKLAEEEPWI